MLLLSFFLINKPSLALTLTWVHFTHKFLSSGVSLSAAHRHLPAVAPSRLRGHPRFDTPRQTCSHKKDGSSFVGHACTPVSERGGHSPTVTPECRARQPQTATDLSRRSYPPLFSP
ncbi:unnamed protein product, partial [Coccothraustes coccothraustes]